MNIKLKTNIWKSDKSRLGFYCVNIFESSEINPKLAKLLESKILKEKEFGPIETINKRFKQSSDYYGSIILNKIDSSDFKTLDYNEFKSEVKEYWSDEDWGEDLPIFKKNFELAISDLKQFELSNRNFYYINTEKTDPKKLTNPNFFTYLVCAISTKKNSNKIITLTFGLD